MCVGVILGTPIPLSLDGELSPFVLQTKIKLLHNSILSYPNLSQISLLYLSNNEMCKK